MQSMVCFTVVCCHNRILSGTITFPRYTKLVHKKFYYASVIITKEKRIFFQKSMLKSTEEGKRLSGNMRFWNKQQLSRNRRRTGSVRTRDEGRKSIIQYKIRLTHTITKSFVTLQLTRSHSSMLT